MKENLKSSNPITTATEELKVSQEKVEVLTQEKALISTKK